MNNASPTLMLIDDYVLICNKIVEKFCIKQNLCFDGWVGSEYLGIAGFNSIYSISINDILLDIKTNQPKGLILEWIKYSVPFVILNENQDYINYKSYTIGLRYKDLKNNG